jgi:hypothetical protein
MERDAAAPYRHTNRGAAGTPIHFTTSCDSSINERSQYRPTYDSRISLNHSLVINLISNSLPIY